MKCIIYLRVSTKEQAQRLGTKEGYSIPGQREACLKYIKEKGWEVIDEYVDRGESAKSSRRPQLQEMLSRIRKEKDVEAVVVHKIDRLARNMEDHITIKAVLKRAGAGLVSVVENIEDSASGHLIEGIHALMAEFYSENLGMEVRKGMEQKVKQGGWPFRAPMGYKNVRVGGDARRGMAKTEIDPETSPYIKEAFELYASGNYSIQQIRDFLLKNGIGSRHKEGEALAHSTVNNMLANPFYIGKIKFDGVYHKGAQEHLITRKLFNRVQSVLEANNVAGVRHRAYGHYLKGTLFCETCGSRLSIDMAKNAYAYFYCLGQKQRHSKKKIECHEKYIAVEDMEAQMEELYKKIQMPKSWSTKLVDGFNEEIVAQHSQNTMEEEFAIKRMERLNLEKKKLMQAFYDGAIPVDVLKDEQKRIAEEIAKIDDKRSTSNNNLEQHTEVLEKAIRIAENCALAYKKAKPETRQLFNQAFFKKVFVKDKKIEGVEYTDLFGALLSKSSSKKELVGDSGFEPLTPSLSSWCSPN